VAGVLVDGEQLRVQRYVMGHSGLEANQRGDDGPFSFLSHVSTVARLRRSSRVDGPAAKAGPQRPDRTRALRVRTLRRNSLRVPERSPISRSVRAATATGGFESAPVRCGGGCGVAAQPGWWVEFGDAGGHVDSPVRMVDESVVAAA